MQDDAFPAAERILADIECVFKKDPELREFDVIPLTNNHNKSPLHHVEHCLGLESWCVRHVYCHAYHRLLDSRNFRHRRPDPEVTSRLLLGALLLNPDVTTFWNMRKELIQAGRLNIQSELHFAKVILSRKPKSAEAFSYRRFVLEKLLKLGEDKSRLLEEELQVCEVAADRYAGNYHAWQHRTWCMTHLSERDEIWMNDWRWSETWMSLHVSDYSGLHYRQFLYSHLLSDEKRSLQACAELISSEVELSADLIIRYPAHEALWNYRRSVLVYAKKYLSKLSTNSDRNDILNGEYILQNGVKCGTDFQPEEFWRTTIQQEAHLVGKCLMKDNYFVQRHVRWLQRTFEIKPQNE